MNPSPVSLRSTLHRAFPTALGRARLVLVTALAVLASFLAPASTVAQRPPNLVFILADDLGLGDLGAYGQKHIRTPNLDRLAAGGLRLTRHYAGNAVCAPSRCVLLTGRHPGHAAVRDNREAQPEGQWPLPADTLTLPRLLRRAGYVTGAFGKWGLGSPGSSGDPRRQGFDRFFGYNCQREAHNYYPTHLWDDERRVDLGNPVFSPHQRFPTNATPGDPAAYRGYRGKVYAPDLIVDRALTFIAENRDRPFFLYLPSTIPHLALQVPNDSLAEYAGQFPDSPYDGHAAYLPHPTPRAAYAAMVSRLDRHVGRVLDQLAELGLESNTVVVFTSDNGPLYDRLGGTDSDFFDSAAGLRGRKGSLYEGGVRVPCLIRWPGHCRPGRTLERLTGFEDWLPTLLELAGATHLVPPGLDGVSFAPSLQGRRQPERPPLYREFPAYGGWQSLRDGDWKLVRHDLNPDRNHAGPLPEPVTELFNLRRDPAETHDRSTTQPRRVRAMLEHLQRSHAPSAAFPFPALDQASLPGRP